MSVECWLEQEKQHTRKIMARQKERQNTALEGLCYEEGVYLAFLHLIRRRITQGLVLERQHNTSKDGMKTNGARKQESGVSSQPVVLAKNHEEDAPVADPAESTGEIPEAVSFSPPSALLVMVLTRSVSRT